MFIDTHCHLNFKAFNKDLDEVINNAADAGIEKIIIPGAKIDSSQKALEIAQQYALCYAAVGIHPHHADEPAVVQNNNRLLSDNLEPLLKRPKVVAIGEIGLDYYRYKNYPEITPEIKDLQKNLFLRQLDLAVKHKLPVILHCRQAHDDMLRLLKSYLINKKLAGVFHCFDGEIKHLKKVLDLGFLVGYDGNITYPENERLRKSVKNTPLDRLLLETDAPFLTPIPFRGNRNEPKNLIYTADTVAKLLDRPVSQISEATNATAVKLFHL